MKYEIPDNHGLSDLIVEKLVHKSGDTPSLSNIQYEALVHGVGRGESALVVAPTSTGKTQIAIWAIAKSLEKGQNTVYLVTHRALANQKFGEFKSLLVGGFLGGNASDLVLATGDSVEDANGDIPSSPLMSPLLVATYEKYLALLSASGVPSDMSGSVIICDEIQLIGDEHRGQNVELLLTLMRNAGWRQFVGLSAVLEEKDAKELADWLGVRLVVEHTREKHLRYECWTPDGIAAVSTEDPERIEEGCKIPPGVECNPLSILNTMLKEANPPVPIIIFCMTKIDTFQLADQFISNYRKGSGSEEPSSAFDGLPETAATESLSKMFGKRIGVHSADLTDEERQIVEQYLLDGKLDVVFATSTLAAGVNFPLGAAVFSKWSRWDFERRQHVPIESDEFHNMAGRVGRMGFEHEQGRIIFIAENAPQKTHAKRYLRLGTLPPIEPRIAPGRFNQLALQLVSSGLCTYETDVERLVCTTFTALREQDRNPKAFEVWPTRLNEAIESLVNEGLLIQSTAGKLIATPVGKAIGYSGLLPETGVYILNYLAAKAETLTSLLPRPDRPGDIPRLAFLLFCACFSSPEFRPHNRKSSTRFLPYPLENWLFDASPYKVDLPEPIWEADPLPVNSARLSLDWMSGVEIRALEKSAPNLRAGMLVGMYRSLVWVLQGMSSILTAACDAKIPEVARPKALRIHSTKLDLLGKLPRLIRRLSFRVYEGLPDDVLWMKELNSVNPEFGLHRIEILALRDKGLHSPEQVMLGSSEIDAARVAAFAKAKPSPAKKANWLRDTCRNWKIQQRKRSAEKHLKRAQRCANVDIIKAFYDSKGTDFEKVFEKVLELLKIRFDKLDDKSKTGAPDYLVKLHDSDPLIIELKSKEGDKLVDYNKAVEVLAASEVHGHKDKFCVTLCHPGVDPGVPMVIAECGRLSVVESTDLGEALLRLCEGNLTQKQLWHWLASPGQALRSDLPFREFVLR
jgi:helicase